MFLPLMLVALTLQDQPPEPVCAADVRWAVDGAQAVSRSVPRSFSLYSAVGRSRSGTCLPAELSLTVAYFDVNHDLLCSGTLRDVATVRDPSQMTYLEFRLTNLTELVRWRNGNRTLVRSLALVCTNEEGTGPIQLGELDRAAYARVYATVTPPYGGLATAELWLTLQP